MELKVTLSNDVLVDQNTAAELLNVSPASLCKWRSTGEHNIPFIKIGRLAKYRTVDLRDFVERNTKNQGNGLIQ